MAPGITGASQPRMSNYDISGGGALIASRRCPKHCAPIRLDKGRTGYSPHAPYIQAAATAAPDRANATRKTTSHIGIPSHWPPVMLERSLAFVAGLWGQAELSPPPQRASRPELLNCDELSSGRSHR